MIMMITQSWDRSLIALLKKKKKQTTSMPTSASLKVIISPTSTSSFNGNVPNIASPGVIETTFIIDQWRVFEMSVSNYWNSCNSRRFPTCPVEVTGMLSVNVSVQPISTMLLALRVLEAISTC